MRSRWSKKDVERAVAALEQLAEAVKLAAETYRDQARLCATIIPTEDNNSHPFPSTTRQAPGDRTTTNPGPSSPGAVSPEPHYLALDSEEAKPSRLFLAHIGLRTWTPDHREAYRFPSKEDAEKAISPNEDSFPVPVAP